MVTLPKLTNIVILKIVATLTTIAISPSHTACQSYLGYSSHQTDNSCFNHSSKLTYIVTLATPATLKTIPDIANKTTIATLATPATLVTIAILLP